MNVFAPGKLVLTGAYAVLEGAPALVVATSRGAVADPTRRAAHVTPEVHAALGDGPAPYVDAAAMFVGDRKLGLGASAAILVASLAAREAARGARLEDPGVRERLLLQARAAHAAAQAGGSGVDVAASVYGGALRYVVGGVPVRVDLPVGTRIFPFACASSARTTELRAGVDRLAERDMARYRACMDDLGSFAHAAAAAVSRGSLVALVAAISGAARGLDRLGAAAGIPIVPSGFDALEGLAAEAGAAFCVSGAGGGDVAVYVGPEPPRALFTERASTLGLFPLPLDLDEKGVRVIPRAPAFAAVTGEAPLRS